MSFRRSGCGCRKCCMRDEQPAQLTASEAAQRINRGVLSSEELVQSCLEGIRALEPTVQAWQFLDEQHALAQARTADERRRSGEPVGALNGIPVGVKDIMDTADMPTENGTLLHKGRTPRADAAVVAKLRAAGAVIMGKTVTTECAYFTPGKTRNPHNPEHTPGGSSSGSAAEEPPLEPRLAFIKTPHWEHADADTKEAYAELVESLAERVEEVELFPAARAAWDWQRTIMEAEMTANLEPLWRDGYERLSERLRGLIDRGRETPALQYQRALGSLPAARESFDQLFIERYEAILTPPALGTAPKGLGATGDPAFCVLWTLLGMPAVTLPLMRGANGLPLGVQLVGRRHFDGRLLRTARWLEKKLA